MPKHHRIFEEFACWEGGVKAGFSVNFLGVVTRDHFPVIKVKHSEKRFERTDLPAFDEEYFEWIDLLEAVMAAKSFFTMIELGAGYGRWLANAAVALRSINNLPHRLIGVEPEPTHYQWIKAHLRDNEVDLRKCRLIKAAAIKKDGSLWFYVGRPNKWYGQAIASPVTGSLLRKTRAWLTKRDRIGSDEVRRVKAISLNKVLQPLQRVDLIDLDVQGVNSKFWRLPVSNSVKRSRGFISEHMAETLRKAYARCAELSDGRT